MQADFVRALAPARWPARAHTYTNRTHQPTHLTHPTDPPSHQHVRARACVLSRKRAHRAAAHMRTCDISTVRARGHCALHGFQPCPIFQLAVDMAATGGGHVDAQACALGASR